MICPRDPELQEKEDKLSAHFCWSHLHLLPSASISLHLHANIKQGRISDLLSLLSQNGSDTPQLSVEFPSGVMPRGSWLWLLVGSKAMVMATGLCHVADELASYVKTWIMSSVGKKPRGLERSHSSCTLPPHHVVPQGNECKLGWDQRCPLLSTGHSVHV